ncbi:MAG: hypothetical protein O2958_08630 [Gemmatimonadetes bacterium]|nr:hypothetical protein [Gemmatimonadota bacterium]MDA1104863.1 hypothetical protein [Gemmatimonadota bacterium]
MPVPAEVDRAVRAVLSHWKLRCFSAAVFLVGISACNEPAPRPVAELVRQGSVFLDPESLKPYSGPVFATFADQPLVIAQRLSLRDGAYDGPYEAYFDNRQLSSKEIYQEGIKHGPYEWYFKNGRLFEEGTYHEGHLDGPYRAYWDSGDLYEEGRYNHGEFDGPRKWYLDGKLIELVTYRDGVIDGPYERYDAEGGLELQGLFAEGTPCGMWIEGEAQITYPACGEVAS